MFPKDSKVSIDLGQQISTEQNPRSSNSKHHAMIPGCVDPNMRRQDFREIPNCGDHKSFEW